MPWTLLDIIEELQKVVVNVEVESTDIRGCLPGTPSKSS
jgi:hypothetical protein